MGSSFKVYTNQPNPKLDHECADFADCTTLAGLCGPRGCPGGKSVPNWSGETSSNPPMVFQRLGLKSLLVSTCAEKREEGESSNCSDAISHHGTIKQSENWADCSSNQLKINLLLCAGEIDTTIRESVFVRNVPGHPLVRSETSYGLKCLMAFTA
jgi:hypothetical protein